MTPPTASNIAKTPSSASLDTDVRSCACKPSEECADCYDPSADEKAKAQAQAQAQARASMASKAYNGGSSNNDDDDDDDDDDGCDHRYGRDSWFAWAVVFAGCIQGMITLGASRAHGVYQEYYVLNEFATSPTASISWIGSLQNTLLNLCGVLVGILSQFVDSRVLSAGGSVVMGLAFVLASFSTQLWQLALTQGALYGAAASFPYILGVTVPMQWVGRNRGFALAVVYMGSGLGGMWISLLTRTCIESLGRQWSQRILGCIMVVLGVGLSPLIIARTPRAEGRQAEGGPRAEEQAAAAAAGVTARPARRTALDFSVVAERRFQLIALASFFAMGPNTIPYLLMPTYVADVLKETSRLGSSLVTIINVSGIFGRFAAGMLSDRFGPVNMLLLWVLLAAFSQLGIWLPFASVPAVIASAALFGVTGASIVGMLLNALSRLYGVRRITYISGLVYMTYAVSSLLVAQTASLMLDTVGHGIDYTWPIVYEGLLLVAAFFVLLALRLRISRRLAFKV